MAMANRRRSRSPPATASSQYFPPELIPEVARRLTSLQDFFALRAACRTYRALLPLTSSNLASQAPLLLAPFEDTKSLALFHPILRRIHRFPFHRTPPADGGFTVTDFHSLGCRLAIYESRGLVGQPTRRNLSIVNLLTGERACLSSPPKPFCRVILYGDLVLTWGYFDYTIQYCHLEAADWRMASIAEPYKLRNLVCVNGTLYALVTPAAASSLNFPPDLLREIASRLTSLQDFFALRAVCRASLPLSPFNLASQGPLLLVPDAATVSHALLHIRRGFLRFRLTRTHLTAETADIHSLGCRVAVDLHDRCQLRIVHVLTGDRTRLPSPPSSFSRLLLSGDLVVALKHLNLQHCRLGNPKWRVA
ncbi:hypothetical protein BAE44_0010027 [Dichanthelium oligosanthes]|uniref:F-box domain-containing protein n=1 Tax=Dichanthelium oligosanthes TaxID=888268 RepID=A0A1E5VV60_9POAL|nr:hypothetical protein BAE44_0010027 [Dichanthelium oligosanthes]